MTSEKAEPFVLAFAAPNPGYGHSGSHKRDGDWLWDWVSKLV